MREGFYDLRGGKLFLAQLVDRRAAGVDVGMVPVPPDHVVVGVDDHLP